MKDTIFISNDVCSLWNELKIDLIAMLSRRGSYREAAGTSRNILQYMSPYNIELFSRNLALKTPDLKKALYFMTSPHCTTAASAAACAH